MVGMIHRKDGEGGRFKTTDPEITIWRGENLPKGQKGGKLGLREVSLELMRTLERTPSRWLPSVFTGKRDKITVAPENPGVLEGMLEVGKTTGSQASKIYVIN